MAGSGGEPLPASLWAATAEPGPETPPLKGQAKAEVAIVGGGFCGLSAALHLAEAGVDTVLLEANEIGWGASGRNGGQVIPTFKDDPDAILARHGPDLGERMVALGAGAGDLVHGLIDRHGIRCAYRREGSIIATHGPASQAAMAERVRQWQARGRPVRLLDASETAELLGTSLYAGGYLDPSGGALNPLSFARGLARAAIAAGARVHAGTSVTAIERSEEGWRLGTSNGAVQARRVLLATGAHTGAVTLNLRRSILPVQSIQIATPPLPEAIRRTLLAHGHVVADSRRLLLYFRFNEEGRLVFGGRGALSGEAIAPSHVEAILRAMHRTFPQLAGVGADFVWAGQIDLTPERRLRVHELGPSLVAVIGFSGRGVALAPAVGKALAEALAIGSLDKLPLPVTPVRPVPLHGLRLPAMALAAHWFRLRDAVEARFGGAPHRQT